MKDVESWNDVLELFRKGERRKEALSYALKYIEMSQGQKVTNSDYKHVLAKCMELENEM